MDTKPTYKSIFEEFYQEYTLQLKDNEKLFPFNFNILDAQCGTIKENSHTNILMKLLEYKNQYGYVFLEDFIRLAGFNVAIDPQKPVKCETEYFDAVPVKKANKTKPGRIDGLIYQEKNSDQDNNFAIIVENKVNGAPPQTEQLKRYIESVIGKGNNGKLADVDDVYVVLLTKDGVEIPDEDSIKFMREKGILNNLEPNSDSNSDQNSDSNSDPEESEQISGPRYFACSYRFDILPWLENNVQPQVIQKEMILNTGIVQYIDFLKGMLGQRDGLTLLREHCKKKFETIINNCLQEHKKNNLKKQNEYLHKLYNYLQNELRKYQKKSDNESKIKVDCINLLQNLVYEKAEEPMEEFMKATKEFFTSGENPLIKEKDYQINHHFTFYYISIRDKNWPRGVYIGWSLAQFLKDEPYAHLSYQDPEKDDCGEDDGLGFKYSKKAKAWRKEYNQEQMSSEDKQKPPIYKGERLKELYESSGIRVIIESIKNRMNKA